MREPLADTFAKHATRLQRMAAIAPTAFALGGVGDASAEVIFDNSTGTSSSGGYVVGEYNPGSVYALGGNFTVPIGTPLHLVGGSIGVSFGASSTGLNEMDLEIAEDVGGGDPVGAILASATISDLPPPSAGRRYDARDASAPGATAEQQSPGASQTPLGD